MRLIETIWAGDSAAERLARLVLSPLGMIYRGAVRVRSGLYDTGVLRSRASAIPVISIGNITVGGTGKTPVSAWIVSRLTAVGRKPAIVLRGYGADEPLVHARLNPSAPVIIAADRVEGIAEAAAKGCDIAVLDDAFQHRRAKRDADLVLVSADDWNDREALLPAGPYREPSSALRRASAIIVTRKHATDERVDALLSRMRDVAPGIPAAVVSLQPGEVCAADDAHERLPLDRISGRNVFAFAGVGNSAAFFSQLETAGASVTRLAFPDHHSYSRADVDGIIARARGADYVVCTLKDAVKVDKFWPAGKCRLWYVSLAVSVERGAPMIDAILERFGQRSAKS